MRRIFRWRPPPIGTALAFVIAVTVGALALMWTMATAGRATLKPWAAVLVVVIVIAGAVAVRRAIVGRATRASTRPPGDQPPTTR